MIVCSHPLAAEAAAQMLRRGGHAVDAVVAAGAALAVVEPSASGLGGDAFFLVDHREDGEVIAVNGSGAAPRELTPETFAGRSAIPLRSPASCTTPGCVLAWWDAWSRWGRLPWAEVLAPAVALARDGFPISWRMGRVNARMEAVLVADPGLRECYTRNGRALSTGETCRPRALAATLEAIAVGGGPAFYGGPVAEALSRGTHEAGGALGAHDLEEHRSVFASPYRLELGDRILLEQPLPSQGVVLSIMAGLTDGGLDAAVERPAEELHRQCESRKVAFALKQAFLTDPDHLPVPEVELVGALLDPEVLARLRRLTEEEPIPVELSSEVTISALEETRPGRQLIGAYSAAGFDPAHPPQSGSGATDTTYLCAADAEGNQVGLIQSIFHPYGSGYQEPSTGVLLNNRACGFSLHPGHINTLRPGKRSLHTLNSYMVRLRESTPPGDGARSTPTGAHGSPWLVGGTPGGDNQVQTNLQILRHLAAGRDLWAGPAPQRKGAWNQARQARHERPRPSPYDLLSVALESPRWRLDPGGELRIESRMPAEIRKRLRAWGHDVVRIGPWDGSGLAQLLVTLPTSDGGILHVGATDPRGEGLALGV